jgi:cell division protein FtsI (penicillin-binding protein 3)
VTARTRRRHLNRLRLYGLLGLAAFGLLAGRLVHLTVLQREEAQRWALSQHHRLVELPPDRGSILDRTGELLAISIDADSIFAVPTEVPAAAEAARLLAPLLGRPEAGLAALLGSAREFVWLARQVHPGLAQRVFELGLPGIRFLKESRRFYPKKSLAGQLLGFLGTDGRGIEGIEQIFDATLRGRPGRVLTEIDARGRQLYAREQVVEPRTSGRDLVLTLDHALQHIAERELARAVQAERAASGVALVLDPKLGDVLALATVPAFDPNRFQQSSAAQWRNRVLSDPFEPGSTLKPFLVAACLEAGLCRPEEPIDCELGSFRVAGHTFEDHERYGILSVAQVLQHSSNIGAMKIGLRLGRDRIYETLRSFGFGARLTDFPPESAGRVPALASWSATSIPAISMGYEVLATPLQLACAYAALANDGLLVRPRFVLSPEALQPAEALGRVLSSSTARAVRSMLQSAVEAGTGRPGRPEALSAAGKTGTAKKLDPRTRRYSPTAVRATFVGMVPAQDPALVILVSLDEPKLNPWGGKAAAPVFKAIAEQGLGILHMPRARAAAAGGAEAERFVLRTPVRPRPERRGPLAEPRQMLGLGVREVLREARRAGWAVRVQGSGYAVRVIEEKAPGRGDPGQDRSRVLLVQFDPLALQPDRALPSAAAAPTPRLGRED